MLDAVLLARKTRLFDGALRVVTEVALVCYQVDEFRDVQRQLSADLVKQWLDAFEPYFRCLSSDLQALGSKSPAGTKSSSAR